MRCVRVRVQVDGRGAVDECRPATATVTATADVGDGGGAGGGVSVARPSRGRNGR